MSLRTGVRRFAVEVAGSDEAAMLAANAENLYGIHEKRDNTSTKSVTVDWDGTNLSEKYEQYLDWTAEFIVKKMLCILELNNYNPSSGNVSGYS